MEYDPPVEKRTTEQLLEIIETKEGWQPDLVEMTKVELIKRGIPLGDQERRRKNKTKYKQRIQAIKERATYTTIEKALIVLFGPLLALLFSDIFFSIAEKAIKRKIGKGSFFSS